MKAKIIHFVSKKAMNMEGIGTETVELLFEKGLIKDAADLFELQKKDFENLPGFAEKSIAQFFEALQNAQKIPFEKVLFALGIRHIGETVAKKIALFYKNLNNIEEEVNRIKNKISFLDPKSAQKSSLLAIEEVGMVIAQSIFDFFSQEANQDFIQKIKKINLQWEIKSKNQSIKNNPLQGKSIVISGTFEDFSREQIKIEIENLGGILSSSLSKKTDFLLGGKDIGPSKYQKARELGIQILNETDFLEIKKRIDQEI